MPFKDREKKRAYDRAWMAKRRTDWFRNKSCVKCGSVDRLELDHIDPTQKITHRIWSWSQERRETELIKCQILCEGCHVIKTKENRESGFLPGDEHRFAKLNSQQVLEIRSLAGILTYRQIAKQFNVALGEVSDIINRKRWANI